MALSRDQLVKMLRRAGRRDLADEAQQTLPEDVDDKTIGEFCSAHGLSWQSLAEQMGGSP